MNTTYMSYPQMQQFILLVENESTEKLPLKNYLQNVELSGKTRSRSLRGLIGPEIKNRLDTKGGRQHFGARYS